ncbi:MAG: 50S ribosomal protein L24 [Candidatus Omnitrophica bacterium]|nr:50S ribosomal protein L24 [Candidatus Omnitrophota bacterium]
MLRIKRDDKVIVMVGKDKGKTGKVIKVFPQDNRVLVEKINLVRKSRRRRSQQDQQAGIIEVEAPLHISNVMLVDRKSNRPTRFRASVLKDGSKIRLAKESGEAL